METVNLYLSAYVRCINSAIVTEIELHGDLAPDTKTNTGIYSYSRFYFQIQQQSIGGGKQQVCGKTE